MKNFLRVKKFRCGLISPCITLGVYDRGSNLRGFIKGLDAKEGVALLLAISEYLLVGTGMGIVLLGVADLLGITLNEFSVFSNVYLLDGVIHFLVFYRKSRCFES